MWKRLDSEGIVEAYKSEFPEGIAPQAALSMLDELSHREWASSVYVVTSLGNLRLTTAPDHLSEKEFPSIFVSFYKHDATVSFVPAGATKAEAGRWCFVNNLVNIVEIYAIRLIAETDAH